jgi:hypothetical protein
MYTQTGFFTNQSLSAVKQVGIPLKCFPTLCYTYTIVRSQRHHLEELKLASRLRANLVSCDVEPTQEDLKRFKQALKDVTQPRKTNKVALSFLALLTIVALGLTSAMMTISSSEKNGGIQFQPTSNFQSYINQLQKAVSEKNSSLIASSEAQLELAFVHLPQAQRKKYLAETLSLLNQANLTIQTLTINSNSSNTGSTTKKSTSSNTPPLGQGQSSTAPGQLRKSQTSQTPTTPVGQNNGSSSQGQGSSSLTTPARSANSTPSNTASGNSISQAQSPGANVGGSPHSPQGSQVTLPPSSNGNAYGKSK